MTQPRKEQIKNLKTKFTRVDRVGTHDIGGTGTVQVIENSGVSFDYDDLIGQSVTGAPGGADEDSPPVLGGGAGPFSVIAGSSFTVTIPGVNGGNPVTVTISGPDIVSLGGSPVLTTSHAAAAINAALGLVGVSTPVALNALGKLILVAADGAGPIFGNDAFITIADVTPGVVAAMGFPGSPATAVGTTAPRRGIVTVSKIRGRNYTYGGHVSLKKADQTPAISAPGALRFFPIASPTLQKFKYQPDVPPGQPLYGRLTQTPGPHISGERFTLRFFRQGPLMPQVVTYASNFATLTGADTVTINVTDPEAGPGFNVVTTFSVAPTTVQDVVDQVNAQWYATTAGDTGWSAGQAAVILEVPGPYAFNFYESFFIKFQTTGPIHIQPDPSVVSSSDLAAFIQAAIVGAGAAGQGQCVAVLDMDWNQSKVVIQSLVSGPASKLEIIPGNPGGSTPGTWTATLDKVGLTVGKFGGSFIAEPWGADEVRFFCPSVSPSASITVSGSALTMGKLGIPGTAVSQSVTEGEEPVPAPKCHALFPETMEFGEVPDDSDTVTQDFLNTDEPGRADPLAGTDNIGISPLLGPDGKILPDFLPKGFANLNVGQAILGAKQTGYGFTQLDARATTPFDPTKGALLIWEGSTTQGMTVGRDRLYLWDGFGTIVRTTNARWDGSYWNKDVAGVFAVRLRSVGCGAEHSYVDNATTTWVDSDWINNVAIDGTGLSPLVTLGKGLLEDAFSALNPRIEATTADATMTLLWENVVAGAPGLRCYLKPNSAGGTFMAWTLNARWDSGGGNYVKDVLGVAATTFFLDDAGTFSLGARQAANNTPWVVWDVFPYFSLPNPAVATGAWNYMLSPLKADSFRNATNPPITVISGASITIVCPESAGHDTFIFLSGASGTTIASVDMTQLILQPGDQFEVIFYHTTWGMQVVSPSLPSPAWGAHVYWEDPADSLLSNTPLTVDHYTFKNIGLFGDSVNRRLLGSVRRYPAVV